MRKFVRIMRKSIRGGLAGGVNAGFITMNLLFSFGSGAGRYTQIMTHIRRHIIGLAVLFGASLVMPAYAAATISPISSPMAQTTSPYVQYAQSTISPSKAKAIAARRVPGAKFVDISRSGGKYSVRMLRKDGRVVDVLIDATTGRVLN